MTSILTIVGARPQFIKAAVVSRAIQARSELHETLIHTGQHYDANMSGVFFEELGLPAPGHHLGIGSGSHGAQTGRMIEALERVMMDEKPDVVLIYGDTNSTLAGAIAAAKLHIPIAHVEAGLRSGNMRMPEEVNRIVADRLSAMLFTPTDTADRNLIAEGTDPKRIRRVGDVMLDAVRLLAGETPQADEAARRDRPYALATIHRAENTDDGDRIRAIVGALRLVAKRMRVVLPLHPRTRGVVARLGLDLTGVETLEPLGYVDMARYQAGASIIITDSGGVQKEAFFHGVRCVTLRDETEWVELVNGGWNRLVPPTTASAVAEQVFRSLDTPFPAPLPLYGDGQASTHIAEELVAFESGREVATS